MGAKVEGFKNFAKYAAVYGGSEEMRAPAPASLPRLPPALALACIRGSGA